MKPFVPAAALTASLIALLAACGESPSSDADTAAAPETVPAVVVPNAPDSAAPAAATTPAAPAASPHGDAGGPRDPFQRLDTNSDGVLTAAEMAEASERGRAMLERADTNGDGQVTRAEIEAAMAGMMQRFDRNGDGVISDDERPPMPGR